MSSEFDVDTEDPADLFMALYDQIGDDPWTTHRVGAWLRRDPWVQEASEGVCRDILRNGRVDRDLIAAIVADGPRGVFAVLKGLDDAFVHANVRLSTTGDTRAMYEWAIREFSVGYLNSDPRDGLLLFRLAAPPRPEGLPARATTFGVVRVPPEVSKLYNVDYSRIRREFDLPFEPRSGQPGRQIQCGCVAMLGDYADMCIDIREEDGDRRYRVGPRADRLRERVRRVLKALDESGVTIGILPEAALSDELLDVWKTTLKANPAAWDGNLQWILVGTGPVGGNEPPLTRNVQ